MGFWVWVDDSLMFSELLAGAGAAAIGATVAELVAHQSSTHLRLRADWLGPAARLPVKFATDLVLVLAVLWRRLWRGEDPASTFSAVPVRAGGSSDMASTKRALLLAGMSFAPNTIALGIDEQHQVLVVHQLVPRPEEPGS